MAPKPFVTIQAFLAATNFEKKQSIRGKIYGIPTPNTVSIMDGTAATTVKIKPDYTGNRDCVRYGEFIRIYNPTKDDDVIVVNSSSGIFATPEFSPLIEQPASTFIREPCLEPICTSDPGYKDCYIIFKVVSVGTVRPAKFGKVEKVVVKDITGFR